MGAPVPAIHPTEQQAAEALLGAFRSIGEEERHRHAAVLGYWLSIRGDRDFPTIRDLDPLQISDAGPCSLLLELIAGGEDAEIRHIGETLKPGAELARIGDAERRSLLACIAGKLAVVAISTEPLAFEDEFETPAGTARCQVTLLPFGSTGPWVDYVYAFVTSQADLDEAEVAPGITAETVEEKREDDMDQAQPMPVVPVEETPESAAKEPMAKGFDPLAGAEGFFGNVVSVELDPPVTAAGGDEPDQSEPGSPLLDRLAQTRAKADEARLARLRSDSALAEGLSAAYDFALDAEDRAEDYLRLVEAQGLKIQLRSPMAPVVRLAFEGRCDEAAIPDLERVMAWALKMNLPRGTLAERIAAEGGIAAILGGAARGQ